MTVQVHRATREDAFAVAALQLQAGIEDGGTRRPTFVCDYADAWLAEFEEHPTWLAVQPNGEPVGVVVTTLTRALPSLTRPRTRVAHIASVFVRPQDRGDGLAERMLRDVQAWCDANGVERCD